MPNTPSQKPTIYTVATAHLDTSWLWRLETTIAEYLPATLRENFQLFEQYPDYTFSFEGAYRYELIEEYYPELFEQLREYIAQGRWRVAGSSYENGDVNIPSPEALFRNILLGNRYFDEKFGKRSVDIFLPDCFGFGRALPGIAAHANLQGFTTQKLTWGAAEQVPFALGRWQGPGGGEIFACPNGHNYTGSLHHIRGHKGMRRALRSLRRRGLHPAALILHGVGDRGGAPKEKSVAAVCGEIAENEACGTAVRSAGSDDIFRALSALPEEERARFPLFTGEWLLSDHGTGCYTARVWSKRWNRRAEQLAQAAEHASAFAGLMGRLAYPKDQLNTAWKRVIAHQFHDDMTGTSIEPCYPRSWNDLMVSQQEFARLYTRAVSAVAGGMDTGFAAGLCVAVSNVTQWPRKESVAARLPKPLRGSSIRVLDCEGRALPCQLSADGGTAIFQASVPPLSVALFDIQVSSVSYPRDTGLRASPRYLENKHMRVTIDDNGDIQSIYSKQLCRECLAGPVRLSLFDFEGSPFYPQWELYYPELKRRPAEYPKKPVIEWTERGPARAAVTIVRQARGSVFRQILSLDADGEWLRVEHHLDWHSPRTLLKAEFPLAAACKEATYDLGFGVASRGNNTRRCYEVPAQQWADITDSEEPFGVSILSDCKTGWDKPNDNTLRLTALYSPRSGRRGSVNTPGAKDGPYAGSACDVLDFGRSAFAFGIYPHAEGWQTGSCRAGALFNQPLAPFYPAAPHPPGSSGKPRVLSFGQADQHMLLRAIKQSEDNPEEWVVRVQEAYGYPMQAGELTLGAGILEWRELYASEEPREDQGGVSLREGVLLLNLKPFEIRTFALKAAPLEGFEPIRETPVELPLERQALPNGLFLPDDTPLLRCQGQTVQLPPGRELHLTMASFGSDKEAVFALDGVPHTRTVFAAREAIGAGDMPGMKACGYVKDAKPVREFWHLHTPEQKDLVGMQAWFFDVSLPARGGALTLPIDSDLVVLEADMRGEPTALPAAPLFDELPHLERCEASFTPKQMKIARKPLPLRIMRVGLRGLVSALRVRVGIALGR